MKTYNELMTEAKNRKGKEAKIGSCIKVKSKKDKHFGKIGRVVKSKMTNDTHVSVYFGDSRISNTYARTDVFVIDCPDPKFSGLDEAKITAAAMVKMFKNEEDWGRDMKDQVYVKKGNLVYIDSWYYGAEDAMKRLVDSWKKGGFNYDYWSDQGVKIKIVDTFTEVKATGRHKKFTKDGIVGVELKIS